MLPRRRFDFKHSSQIAIWLGLNVRFARLISQGNVVQMVHLMRFSRMVYAGLPKGNQRQQQAAQIRPDSIYLSPFQLRVIVSGVITYAITPLSRFIVEYNREWSFSKAKLVKNTDPCNGIFEVSSASKRGGICTLKSSVIDSPLCHSYGSPPAGALDVCCSVN